MVTVFTFPHVWITEEKYKECEGRREEKRRRGEEKEVIGGHDIVHKTYQGEEELPSWLVGAK